MAKAPQIELNLQQDDDDAPGFDTVKDELLRLMLLGEGLVSASTLRQDLGEFKRELQGAYQELTSPNLAAGGGTSDNRHALPGRSLEPAGSLHLDTLLAELSVFNIDGTNSRSQENPWSGVEVEGEGSSSMLRSTGKGGEGCHTPRGISSFLSSGASTPMTDNPLFGDQYGSPLKTPQRDFSFSSRPQTLLEPRQAKEELTTPQHVANWLEASSRAEAVLDASNPLELPTPPASLSSVSGDSPVRPADLFSANSPPGTPTGSLRGRRHPPSFPRSSPPPSDAGPSGDSPPLALIRCPDPVTPPTAPILPSPYAPPSGGVPPASLTPMRTPPRTAAGGGASWGAVPRGSQSEGVGLALEGGRHRGRTGGLGSRRAVSEARFSGGGSAGDPPLADLQTLQAFAQELASELEDQNSILHSQMLSAEKQLQEFHERLVSRNMTPVREAGSSAQPVPSGLDEPSTDGSPEPGARIEQALRFTPLGADSRAAHDSPAADWLRQRLAGAEAELAEARAAAAGSRREAAGREAAATAAAAEEAQRADELAAKFAESEQQVAALAEQAAGWRAESEALRARLRAAEAEIELLRRQLPIQGASVTPSSRRSAHRRDPFGEIYPSNLGGASRPALSPLPFTPEAPAELAGAPSDADGTAEAALDFIRQDRLSLEAQLTASEMRAADICRRLASTREAFATRVARQKAQSALAPVSAPSPAVSATRSVLPSTGAWQRLGGAATAPSPSPWSAGSLGSRVTAGARSGVDRLRLSQGASAGSPASPLALAIAEMRARENGLQMNFAAKTPPSAYRSPASPERKTMRWGQGVGGGSSSVERPGPRRVFAELGNTPEQGGLGVVIAREALKEVKTGR